ncbi:membrane transport protein-domain-containing protein, partial [Fomes fomentarius]
MAGPPVGPLLKTVLNSILRVFFVCLAGYILAWRGILDTDTRRKLNRVNTSLLAPSLLFSKVAFSLSPDKLRELWIIPIIFTITTVISMLVACFFATILRLKKSQRQSRAFSVAASMFMNSNSLPVALMQSLVATVPDLKWEDDDNEDTMIGRALTYLVMYLTLGMLLRWSYGVHLLSQGDPESTSTKVLRGAEGEEETRLLVGSEEIPVHPLSHMSTPNEVAEEGEYAMEYRHSSASPPSSSWHSHGHRPLKVLKALNDFMTAPLWAALASLVVACIPPLQRTLDHRLPPVKGAIALLGDASIPTTLLILGAYFYASPNTQRQPHLGERYRGAFPEHTDLQRNPSRTPLLKKIQAIFSAKLPKCRIPNTPSAEVHPGETKTVIVVVLSRMIIAPLLLMPFITIATTFRLQKILDDPVFVVSTVLLIASPPALTLAQITQSTSGESEAYERLLSKTMFWTYCVLTPLSMIVFAIMGLYISK